MGNLNNGALERNDSRRVALVTGGSRGIGRACAVGLAEDGFDIAVVYAGSVDAAHETCEACEAVGAAARAYQCDVADPAAVNACVEAVLNDFGSIWALVNNAGITRDGLLMRMGDDAFDRVLDVNLKGTFNMTRALTKTFMRQRGGCVVNMSSVVGLMGNAGQANYGGGARACAPRRASERGRPRVCRDGYDGKALGEGSRGNRGADSPKAHGAPRGSGRRGALFGERCGCLHYG